MREASAKKVKYLLFECHVNPNEMKKSTKSTALIMASQLKNDRKAKKKIGLLLQAGAHVDVQDMVLVNHFSILS